MMAIIVRKNSNSGSMAMVAEILSLMMTTILPQTVTAGCMCGRAPWTPNPMRGVAKDGRPRNFANDHRGLGQRTGSGRLSGRMFLAHKGSCDAWEKRTCIMKKR